MKQKISILVILTLAILSCTQKNTDFLISKKQVGKITDSTKVKDLKALFKNDSLIKNTEGQSAFEAYDEYTLYDKKTKKPVLIIVPTKPNDDNSLIKTVEIINDKFKTDKGISINSNFKDFKQSHKVGKVDESFKYLVVYIDDLNATVDIKKSELPLEAQNNPSIKVDATIIPENAKIKHFIVFIND